MSELILKTYQQLAETAPVLFYAVDNNLHLTYVNAFFYETHTNAKPDAIGLSIEEILGTEAFNNNLPHYQKALAGQTVRYQSHFLKLDGNPIHYHAIYTPIEIDGQLQGFTGVVLDVTAEKELEYISKTDPLTGLSNRREFEHQLGNLLDGCSRATHGLFFVDIDFFKSINDQYGHDAGDQALVNLSQLLNRDITYPAQPFRIGGEEFAILFTDTDDPQALYEKAEQLRKTVETTPLIEQKSITVSIGAVMFQAGEDKSCLLKRVDIALYQCKTGGRNQVQLII